MREKGKQHSEKKSGEERRKATRTVHRDAGCNLRLATQNTQQQPPSSNSGTGEERMYISREGEAEVEREGKQLE